LLQTQLLLPNLNLLKAFLFPSIFILCLTLSVSGAVSDPLELSVSSFATWLASSAYIENAFEQGVFQGKEIDGLSTKTPSTMTAR